MKSVGLSDPGRVRPRNEDRFLIRAFDDDHLLVAVMDGMGGQAGGELAAQTAHDVLRAWTIGSGPISQQLHDLVLQANQAVVQAEEARPELQGLGCTLIAALISQHTAHWVHVGDSRLYICAASGPQLVTTDQNMAQFLVEEGEMSETEAMTSPMRNLLDQCLGGSFMEEESGSFPLQPGDRLVLCSDGVHDELTADAINTILAQAMPVQQLGEALLQAALAAGGNDNITVVVIEH